MSSWWWTVNALIPSRWVAESAILYSACLTYETEQLPPGFQVRRSEGLRKREMIPTHSWEGIAPGHWRQCHRVSASCALHSARSCMVPWGWVEGETSSAVSPMGMWVNSSPLSSECFFVCKGMQSCYCTALRHIQYHLYTTCFKWLASIKTYFRSSVIWGEKNYWFSCSFILMRHIDHILVLDIIKVPVFIPSSVADNLPQFKSKTVLQNKWKVLIWTLNPVKNLVLLIIVQIPNSLKPIYKLLAMQRI